MYCQRPMTEAERAELAALTEAVRVACDKRRAWLDAMMLQLSALKPGDDLYDLETGEKLGVVSALKRWHRDESHEHTHDDSPSCYVEYETRPRCFNNSSGSGISCGTLEMAKQRAQARLDRLG